MDWPGGRGNGGAIDGGVGVRRDCRGRVTRWIAWRRPPALGTVALWVPTLLAGVALACGESVGPDPCASGFDCRPWFRVFTPPFGTIFEADIPTYEGSGQTVHPDVVVVPPTFSAEQLDHWLAITPYPGGNAQFENPSILASMNPQYWGLPRGLTNPIALPDDVGVPLEAEDPPDFEDEAGEVSTLADAAGHGHFSDPDLVWIGRLVLYFRYSAGSDYVFRATSDDGVRWSKPQLVLEGPFASILSPAAVVADTWRIWAVDGRNGGCRASATRVMLRESGDGVTWSDAAPIDLALPGYVPWHLDVQWIGEHEAYWALVAAYPEGATCGATDLFLATSADGNMWETFPAPVLRRGAEARFENAVYRSTFRYDAKDDAVTIWYSGYTASEWRTAVERVRWGELMRRTGGG